MKDAKKGNINVGFISVQLDSQIYTVKCEFQFEA